PFHHGPSKGGPAEDTKFANWYERTLDSYAHFFGHRPPADIWPPVAIRFGGQRHYQRICLSDAWIIRKPRFPRRRAAFAAIGLAAIPIILASSNDSGAGPWILFGAMILIALAIVASKKGGKGGGGSSGSGCSGSSCGGDSGHGHGHGGGDGGHGGGHGCGGGHGGCGGGSSCGGGSCGGGGCGGH
ncbi:MAG: hypothetical protein ABJF10_28880, partial [Chthoniobacter sp.]